MTKLERQRGRVGGDNVMPPTTDGLKIQRWLAGNTYLHGNINIIRKIEKHTSNYLNCQVPEKYI